MPYDINGIVCIYLAEEKLVKRLPKSRSISARRIVKERILEEFGENEVAIKEKSIEK